MQQNYAASMWAVLNQFRHKGLPEELNGAKVHHLENMMNLDAVFYTAFDRLDVWFVAMVRRN